MRTAYKVWSGIAAGVFCLVAATDLSGGASRFAPAATTATAPAGPASPTVTVATAAARPGSASVVTGPVTRVIDGDTLEVAGERVRVLGIDACEIGTTGGATAKDRAVSLVGGRTVALRAEPGADRDRSGRALRYVEVDDRDFGLAMVGYPDTGVFAGRNDADPAYVAQLRAADTDGRTCGRSTAPSGTTSSPTASATPSPATPSPATSAVPRPAPRAVPRPPVVPDRPVVRAAAYANCTAARAAGVTPLRRGQPGYSASLDRDGDGVACE